ncbi:MAG: hypothetical protein COU35_03225 [Candidatus Magasanikbacteria bacterium CG10_big_fil_rev_8_21_14_0_10_47_10]|uniref:Uncharacterized protein n=1 Tax=Candidatus Magasanikbacteria bacterium CG10_big_fil_rev_8_21_14_0_10_47_10 TaxID=1974652 RepID=A0A2H0TQ47_9BACT|nr:MAG: hypothetical protein COU35_03225 [Candidatus Magasanikbacteria bacterium CG10_big_fil_rev_8_21_14_0_10_47_10]
MFGKKQEDKLKKYQDTSGSLSSKGLERGIWFVRHKLQLRKIIVIILSSWGAITVGIGLIIWGKYIAYDYWQDRALYRSQVLEFPNYESRQNMYEARPLIFGQPQVYQGSRNTYDLVTPVSNPNPMFVAHIHYEYQFATGRTPAQTVTILPGTESYAPLLGFENESFPARAQLVVDDIVWERLDTHVIADPASFREERLAFEPENLAFTQSQDGIGSTLTFDLTNNSVYSYWQADFLVLLYRGNDVVGVVHMSEPTFRGGERRSVDYRLYQDVGGVSRIELIPLINIFDSHSYLPVGQ